MSALGRYIRQQKGSSLHCGDGFLRQSPIRLYVPAVGTFPRRQITRTSYANHSSLFAQVNWRIASVTSTFFKADGKEYLLNGIELNMTGIYVIIVVAIAILIGFAVRRLGGSFGQPACGSSQWQPLQRLSDGCLTVLRRLTRVSSLPRRKAAVFTNVRRTADRLMRSVVRRGLYMFVLLQCNGTVRPTRAVCAQPRVPSVNIVAPGVISAIAAHIEHIDQLSDAALMEQVIQHKGYAEYDVRLL